MEMNDYMRERKDVLKDWKEKNTELLDRLKNKAIKHNMIVNKQKYG